jgi:hypothetical protein
MCYGLVMYINTMFHKFSQEYLRTYTERYGGGELCFRDGVVGEKSDKKTFFFFSQTIYAHRKSFLLFVMLLLLFTLSCSIVRKSFSISSYSSFLCKTKIFKNVNFFQLQHKKTSSTFTGFSLLRFRSHFCVIVGGIFCSGKSTPVFT